MSYHSTSLRILLVEDQQNIASNIADFMEQQGHVIDFAIRGDQGLALAMQEYYDLVILDLNLPGIDGIEVCRQLRNKAQRHIPVLMLTARDSVDDKVIGFTAGADDYLTKPFSLQELEVRCIALSRRHLLQTNDVVTIGPLRIDRKRQVVMREDTTLPLQTMGYRILVVLAEAYPQVVSRSELTYKLWGDEPTESDAIRSHIYQLRNVLDKPFSFPMLKTKHGVGFALQTESEAQP
ncbi:response regulator transcription factor [Alteromonas sp. ASW11-130]|uniref:response regulator transcription factor n=1 Tax=Alteromonas sp. ASW11-130 TaxID=3015775 RepID=UPI0022426CA1|nr:response regulator transcription factor [Alteromonas sp. ASW11-130]MCW8093311.1 response regulator transcription factor [Alteromonas sp. ASW11-130]